MRHTVLGVVEVAARGIEIDPERPRETRLLIPVMRRAIRQVEEVDVEALLIACPRLLSCSAKLS